MNHRRMGYAFAFLVSTILLTPLLAAGTTLFPCMNAGDGTWTILSGAKRGWVPTGGYLYFKVPELPDIRVGSEVYVRITYRDDNLGSLSIDYDSLRQPYDRTDLHSRSTGLGSGEMAVSWQVLRDVAFRGRQNGDADFRIAGRLPVYSVEIFSTPIEDSVLARLLDPPWLRSWPEARPDAVPNGDMKGKLSTGYQAWFRTPNDPDDNGWRHWFRDDRPTLADVTVDMWPDPKDYPASSLVPIPGLKTRSGKQAYLFSSADPAVVDRHFRWMRDYRIDLAFLQRFTSPGGPAGRPENALANVRASASRYGRLWAIEFDLSCLDEASALKSLKADWEFLVERCHILEDERYMREGRKPVVVVWGYAFPDRDLTPETGRAIVDYLKNDPMYGGNHVIIGVFSNWPEMTAWRPTLRSADEILVWMTKDTLRDFSTFKKWGIANLPHAFPGFSWGNLNHIEGTSEFIPRGDGAFFWSQVAAFSKAGADRLFLGMFDEYDEGTAFMPMSDDPPEPPPGWGRFLTNEGYRPTYWLELGQAAMDMIRGVRRFSAKPPDDLR